MDTFTLLADPTRRQIIESLSSKEQCFGDLARQFQISAPAVSQHLKALRGAGLVSVRVDAQRRYYKLEPGGLIEVNRWLDRVQRFWPDKLDRLEQALRDEENAQ